MSELNYSSSRILVVDDDPDVLLAARLLLKQHVAEVVTEPDPIRSPIIRHLFELYAQGEYSLTAIYEIAKKNGL